MEKPRLQKKKIFPSVCKANVITTSIKSSENVESENNEQAWARLLKNVID